VKTLFVGYYGGAAVGKHPQGSASRFGQDSLVQPSTHSWLEQPSGRALVGAKVDGALVGAKVDGAMVGAKVDGAMVGSKVGAMVGESSSAPPLQC
jgi:hypothetical protein